MRRFRRCVPPSALALALALAALPVGAVCTSFTTPALASVPAAGAADTVTVPVTLCQTTPWNATADVPWITASGGNSGVFEATSVVVSYTVAPNPTNAPRVGRITGLPAGVLPFEITQAGSDVTVVPT